jgi:hypothetical protein
VSGEIVTALFAETQSRFVVSVNAENKAAFVSLVPDAKLAGMVTDTGRYVIRSKDEQSIIDIEVTELLSAWKGAIPCLLKSVD